MAYPHRIFEGNKYYRVRNDCCEGQVFFRDDPLANAIIIGLLAKYASKMGIKIVGFIFMPAYFEMILMSPDNKHHQFMRNFEGQVAKALNLYWGHSDHFFVGRYQCSEIAEESLTDAFLDMLCLPVAQNYVLHPKEWPGVSSWNYMINGEEIVGSRQDRKKYWKLRRRKSNDDKTDAEIEALVTEVFGFELAKLPAWEGLDDEVYAAKVQKEVADKIEVMRAFCTEPVTGLGVIPAHPCDERPGVPKEAKLPLYLTDCEETWAACKESRRDAVKRYREAARKLRRGQKNACFPRGMIPPGYLHCVGSPGAAEAGEDRGAPVEEVDDAPEVADGS
jgi:hypothetical protein